MEYIAAERTASPWPAGMNHELRGRFDRELEEMEERYRPGVPYIGMCQNVFLFKYILVLCSHLSHSNDVGRYLLASENHLSTDQYLHAVLSETNSSNQCLHS